MTPERDEGPAGEQGLSSSYVTARGLGQFTTKQRPSPTWHAVATATLVTARTGSRRWLLTYRCPGCSSYERHLAQTKALREVIVRKTACGHGTVALHVATEEAA